MSENTKMLAKLDGLAEFLQTGGNTLLIKGDAGTGKTTLALQLMKSLAGKDGGVYISARV
jgi:DNA replication protein DnaC